MITSANAHLFFENFKFIYDLWVREFNFLPEYYRPWTKKGLVDLQKGFQQILDFHSKGNSMYLVNSENYSETSFFNLGIVIDTDGSIYGTNLILAGIFEKYKPELKIGDIYSGISIDIHDATFQSNYVAKVQEFLKMQYDEQTIKSVRYVDMILSNFVNQFEWK